MTTEAHSSNQTQAALCRCGCGSPVTEGRVFVNKTHQLAWQRRGREEGGGWYRRGFWITAVVTFFSSWIYCIASYGFLFGVGLGWLPSLIVAPVVGALWPLLAVGVAGVALLLLWSGLQG